MTARVSLWLIHPEGHAARRDEGVGQSPCDPPLGRSDRCRYLPSLADPRTKRQRVSVHAEAFRVARQCPAHALSVPACVPQAQQIEGGSTRELVVERAEVIGQALRRFSDSKADFADCLIERCANAAGGEYTVTFDQKAAKTAGMRHWV